MNLCNNILGVPSCVYLGGYDYSVRFPSRSGTGFTILWNYYYKGFYILDHATQKRYDISITEHN